jgi:hypothetical protein
MIDNRFRMRPSLPRPVDDTLVSAAVRALTGLLEKVSAGELRWLDDLVQELLYQGHGEAAVHWAIHDCHERDWLWLGWANSDGQPDMVPPPSRGQQVRVTEEFRQRSRHLPPNFIDIVDRLHQMVKNVTLPGLNNFRMRFVGESPAELMALPPAKEPASTQLEDRFGDFTKKQRKLLLALDGKSAVPISAVKREIYATTDVANSTLEQLIARTNRGLAKGNHGLEIKRKSNTLSLVPLRLPP